MMPSADFHVGNATGVPESDGFSINDESGIRGELNLPLNVI